MSKFKGQKQERFVAAKVALLPFFESKLMKVRAASSYSLL